MTIAIIIINTLVFIYELTQGQHLEDKIMQFAVIPYNLIHTHSPRVLLTLVTSLFFHAGLAHLFGNMLYLWVFGNNIEDRLGHLKFVFFYLLCGVVATFGHLLTNANSKIPVLGASGAISGVLGAYLILYPRAKVLVLIPLFYIWRIAKVQALWFLVFWIVLQFLYAGTTSALTIGEEGQGVAWFAHIAGFFSGILFLRLFLRKDTRITDEINRDF